MPVMAMFRSPRVDRNLYDAIIQELDLERRPATGAITHACGFDESGICVIDVWESREDFDAFLSKRLQPVFDKLKIDPGAPTIIDAYAFTATGEIDHYKGAAATGVGAGAPFAGEQPGLEAGH